jgi:hypothetical protein
LWHMRRELSAHRIDQRGVEKDFGSGSEIAIGSAQRKRDQLGREAHGGKGFLRRHGEANKQRAAAWNKEGQEQASKQQRPGGDEAALRMQKNSKAGREKPSKEQ